MQDSSACRFLMAERTHKEAIFGAEPGVADGPSVPASAGTGSARGAVTDSHRLIFIA